MRAGRRSGSQGSVRLSDAACGGSWVLEQDRSCSAGRQHHVTGIASILREEEIQSFTEELADTSKEALLHLINWVFAAASRRSAVLERKL